MFSPCGDARKSSLWYHLATNTDPLSDCVQVRARKDPNSAFTCNCAATQQLTDAAFAFAACHMYNGALRHQVQCDAVEEGAASRKTRFLTL
jgi:hypothetical protein